MSDATTQDHLTTNVKVKSVRVVRSELRHQYGDLFEFAIDVVKRNQAIAGKWRPSDVETAVVLYHFSRGVNLLEATRRLCLDGFAREAISPSRSLLNILINIRWLTKSGVSTKRIKKFTDHEVTSKANMAMTLIKWDPEITEELKQGHRAIIREAREDAKRREIPEGKDGLYPNWHPGIRTMAKDVGLLSEYHITYARLSQTEHTDPQRVREYVEAQPSESLMTAMVGPCDAYALVVMMDSIRYFLNVKRDAARFLELNQRETERLKHEIDEFSRVREKYNP